MSESKPVIFRSSANPTLRHLIRMRDNRSRRKANRVLVDGWREASQAIRAGMELCGIFVPESLNHGKTDEFEDAIEAVMVYAQEHKKLNWVADRLMEKISYGQSSRGVVAEFVRPNPSLNSLDLPENPLILVLDEIEKPGNIGAVFRSADAAGVDVILLSDCVDQYNPNSIRSSLGTIFQIPSFNGTESELRDFLISRSIQVFAARVESSKSLWKCDLKRPTAVVLGSEARGLKERWRSEPETYIAGIRIPMAGEADSLNIAASAAIIAFEAARQRSDQ
jgi:RNA methyltransferase, TrmH family